MQVAGARWTQAALATALVAAGTLAGCEPADTGGGAGVGGRLAFVRTGKLVVSADDGSHEVTYTDDGTSASPAFTPNGQTIALLYNPNPASGSKKSLYQVGVADEQLIRLAQAGDGETFGPPAWSRDGSKLFFTSTDAQGHSKLMQVTAGGGSTAIPLGGAPADLTFPVPVTDTQLLVSAGGALKLLDLGTNQLADLGVSSQGRAAVSNDGLAIAYTVDESGGHVAMMTLATKAVTPLSMSPGGGDVNPCFSPDAAFVAFENQSKIYSVRANGSGPVTPLQSGNDIAWSVGF